MVASGRAGGISMSAFDAKQSLACCYSVYVHQPLAAQAKGASGAFKV